MPAQLVSTGNGPSIPLDKPIVLLGRQDECDIVLDSRKVSRKHCCLALINQMVFIRDLSSTNGCLVNGRRFREHRLQDGDLITVGQHQMRFAGQSGTRRANEQSVADAENHPLSDSMTRVAGLMPT